MLSVMHMTPLADEMTEQRFFVWFALSGLPHHCFILSAINNDNLSQQNQSKSRWHKRRRWRRLTLYDKLVITYSKITGVLVTLKEAVHSSMIHFWHEHSRKFSIRWSPRTNVMCNARYFHNFF